ncbi:hypothetical protein AKJ65_05435 [candidate division MSBL1 archaeon SCGC-AAA259E19]|uniref:Uncharacterized protein n=2 Tax=candidate division MSBL1 TaxID=215777 RepID=A0A133V1G2_9EURY|nr:hypothetical protein AKJ65_05435 [candidate division MSBL1 archaeon SCGC-AAA259E19]KXB00290.1 hypothetical protein AKJ41_04185 [candidate division MSBL1 archaeon SCGC-AAA259O05]
MKVNKMSNEDEREEESEEEEELAEEKEEFTEEEIEESEKLSSGDIAGVPSIYCLEDEAVMDIEGIELKEVEKRKFIFGTETESHQHLRYRCPVCEKYFLYDLEGRGGGAGGCFIATAAFGTPLASEINVLRRFRDSYLNRKDWGKGLVSIYYTLSPPIAKIMERSERMKKLMRNFLRPLVNFFKREESDS